MQGLETDLNSYSDKKDDSIHLKVCVLWPAPRASLRNQSERGHQEAEKWKWFRWLKESALIMCSSGRINRRQEVTGQMLLLSLVDSTLNPSAKSDTEIYIKC